MVKIDYARVSIDCKRSKIRLPIYVWCGLGLLVVLGGNRSVFADHTMPRAELSVDPVCDPTGCFDSIGAVQFWAVPADCQTTCSIHYMASFWSNPCGYNKDDLSSLRLHLPSGSCDVADAGIDLLSGEPFTFTNALWENMFDGESFVVVGVVGPEIDPIASVRDKVKKYLDSGPIPTVSEWGLLAMAELVLIAGTVIIKRRSAFFA